ncbi:hypothetical protein QM565_36850 [Geitlerinema splendidum]|nr:hypothetical protein [Geitlerinema splendidum]
MHISHVVAPLCPFVNEPCRVVQWAVRPLDTAIFRWINEWPDLLEPFFYAISEGNKWWPVRILLLAVFFFVFTRSKKAAVTALFSWLPANELCDLLKNGFKMPRPNVELADVQLRVGEMTSFGTASAHSANMMAVATVFWLLYRLQDMYFCLWRY